MKKKIEANEGGKAWRDKKAIILDCIVQKIKVTPSRDVWEENCTDFELCDGMPVKGTKEYNWKNTQLSSGPAGWDAKMKKEIESNEGGTMWRDEKARLLNCIA
jgi:hypothetical protein